MCSLVVWAEREGTLLGSAGQVLGTGMEERMGTRKSRTPIYNPKASQCHSTPNSCYCPVLLPSSAPHQYISLLLSSLGDSRMRNAAVEEQQNALMAHALNTK